MTIIGYFSHPASLLLSKVSIVYRVTVMFKCRGKLYWVQFRPLLVQEMAVLCRD